MSGWSKPATPTAAKIGARTVERLLSHCGDDFTDRDLGIIARASALAADDVLDRDETTLSHRDLELAHEDGFDTVDAWRQWWLKRP